MTVGQPVFGPDGDRTKLHTNHKVEAVPKHNYVFIGILTEMLNTKEYDTKYDEPNEIQCRLTIVTSGAVDIPEKTYQEFYSETGNDVDVRGCRIGRVIKRDAGYISLELQV